MATQVKTQIGDLKPDRANWKTQTQLIHTLSIFSMSDTSIESLRPYFVEYAFPAGLEGVDSSEPPATTITFLQGDGVHIEHGGIRQKPFSISGTTGLRPNRIPGTKIPYLNVTLPSYLQSVADDTGLNPEEQTGFDDLVRLVNAFRKYQRAMKESALARKHLRMAWVDAKLKEAWIVEPIGQGITLRQSARSPMTYAFDISLLGVTTVQRARLALEDQFGKQLGGFAGFLQRIQRFTGQINESFNFISAVISRAGIVAQATVNTVLGPVRAILDGVRGVIGSTTRFLQIPRNFVIEAAGNVAAFINDVRAFGNRVSTDPFYTNGMLTQVAQLFHYGRSLEAGLNRLAMEDHLFAPAAGTVLANRRQRYASLDPVSNGNPADIRNLRPINGAAEAIVSSDDTIESMARRTLGDASRWMELVLMNNLRAPYVSRGGNGTDVLRPDDRFLFPDEGAATGNNVARAQGVSNSGTLQAQLGTDFLLEGSMEAADWGIAGGDIAEISGGANFAQALQMRVSTTMGSLPLHPAYGVPFAVGRKVAEMTSLTKWRVDTEGSLLQDPRTKAVNGLFVALNGNTIRMSGSLTSITGDTPLGLNFAVQR